MVEKVEALRLLRELKNNKSISDQEYQELSNKIMDSFSDIMQNIFHSLEKVEFTDVLERRTRIAMMLLQLYGKELDEKGIIYSWTKNRTIHNRRQLKDEEIDDILHHFKDMID